MLQIRSKRERLLQSVAYEAFGLITITPILYLLSDQGLEGSLILMVILSLIAMSWAGLFNHYYDVLEHRRADWAASERPFRWRFLHACLLEAGLVVLTLPVIKILGSMSWMEALLTDIALTGAYLVYGYIFFCIYDRLRPVTVERCESLPEQ